MLVPSGSNAAYVVADYCGGILAPQAAPGQARVDLYGGIKCAFADGGYEDTVLYDPSGFDMEARTTVLDLNAVVLLEYP